MGNYNSQYENYYKTFTNRSNYNTKKYGNHNKVYGHKKKKNFIIRRVIQDLAGVLVMFLFVIMCKFIVTPQTKAAYSYCKDVVNKNFNYKIVINSIKHIDRNKSVQDIVLELMDKAKVKFVGGETIKEKIKEKFKLPTSGDIKESKEGIYYKGKIAATYDGKVKECSKNSKYGNYILIDHGEGIESQYCSLNKVLVKKGDKVKRGDIIAENYSNGKKNSAGFKILFMGQDKGLEKVLENKD
ncbi:peptidase M23 [Clostridium novyi A str. 4552]|uniref:Peptidase M23 n=1 Tax=Clostridium novyi A str. 4552 TaxID=1444289 RepID=A0A0A0IC56_CLONO|nr:M23 family metallopeptidase [Clostridium novyi]KGM97941.1 peptidase M23 [Clostridium novyi A str. 4552]